jgi:hypothetical protein
LHREVVGIQRSAFVIEPGKLCAVSGDGGPLRDDPSSLLRADSIAACGPTRALLGSLITEERPMKRPLLKNYGYLWTTTAFFLLSLAGHWIFGWFAYVDEQVAHQQPIAFGAYLMQVGRDTLENWQSEFLQLIWQVAGLAYLLYVGSPQSKEGDDRKEAKLDAILRAVDARRAEATIAELDRLYARDG